MLRFTTFIKLQEEVKSSTVKLAAKGAKSSEHFRKYVKPFIGSTEDTHHISTDAGHIKKGDTVRIDRHEIDDNGTHHVYVAKGGDTKTVKVPQSALFKNKQAKNKGFANEGALASHLKSHGLMKRDGAGFTAGNDFELHDNRTNKSVQGSSGEHHQHGGDSRGIQGEHKSDIKTTAFGQLTVTKHPETGKWHISDSARSKRPEYAKSIENAKVKGPDGKTRSLLDHMNKYDPPGTTNKSGGYSEHTDLHPAHAYMRDHHVDVAHIDSHGTFIAGQSEHTDRHKLGLPKMEGQGRFRYRQKQSTNPNSRSIQFGITSLNKSHTNIGTDEGVKKMKEKLGHPQ